MTFHNELLPLAEKEYQAFQVKLVPTVNPDTILGIRVPALRKFVKGLPKEYDYKPFLLDLPHKYYEENLVHSFLLDRVKSFEECIEYVGQFLPYVDNWAVCDTMHPKALKKNKEKLLAKAMEWIYSTHTYTIRYGVDIFMTYFLDEDFKEEYNTLIANIISDEYYVNMMIAWYFATALAKKWDETIPYLEKKILSSWVHKKTIQKAMESYRITDIQKEYLRKLRG